MCISGILSIYLLIYAIILYFTLYSLIYMPYSLKRAAANSAMCLRKLDFAPLFTDKSAASTQLPLGLMYCVHFNGSFHDVSLRTTYILAAAGAFNGSLRYEPLAAYLIFYELCIRLICNGYPIFQLIYEFYIVRCAHMWRYLVLCIIYTVKCLLYGYL